jgi:hypothetical protein
MAKKRHHKKKTTHRRRRIGAASSHSMMGMAESLGGLVVGSMVATVMQRQFTSINPKLISVGQMVAGVYLSKKPSPLMAGIGWGMASAGAIGLTHEVGLIHGIEDTLSGLWADGAQNTIEGMQNQTTLSGMQNGTTLTGMQNYTTLSGSDTETEPMPEAPMPMGWR